MKAGVIVVLLFMLGPGQVALTAERPPSVLDGHYVWEASGERGALRVTFTPTGEETWEVLFELSRNGTTQTYRGTASGSLLDGTLQGEVMNEGKDRTFAFEGTMTDGEFRGAHAETTGGTRRHGGSLTMTPVQP